MHAYTYNATQVDSIWLFAPLDSTALHTPFPTCTLERTFSPLPFPHPFISLSVALFVKKKGREATRALVYILCSRILVISVSLTLDLQNDQRGFRFISRLSIRHLIYSVYRAPRSAGGTLRLSHYGLSPDCGKKRAGSETWLDYVWINKIIKWWF